MFGIHNFGLFVVTVLLINISPGTTFLAVTSNSITRGTKAGVICAAGAGCGLLIYALLSWLGLSTLIIQSKVLFNIIKYSGILYLFYCSIQAFTQKPFDIAEVEKQNNGKAFKTGLFVNLLNPFTLVFFLTLIPQFVNVTVVNAPTQMLFMGCWITFSATVVNMGYAIMFGAIGKYLIGKPLFWKYQGIITGSLFLYLAIRFIFH
jgi:threonine/homoserine/homoserine lactone efflux protein